VGERIYKDSGGRECSLQVLCRREPEWAASRIAALEAALAHVHELAHHGGKLGPNDSSFENLSRTMREIRAAGEEVKGG